MSTRLPPTWGRGLSLGMLACAMAVGFFAYGRVPNLLYGCAIFVVLLNFYYLFVFSGKAYLVAFSLWQSTLLLIGFVLIPKVFLLLESINSVIFIRQPTYVDEIGKYPGSLAEFSILISAIILSVSFVATARPLDAAKVGWLEKDFRFRMLALGIALGGSVLYGALRSVVPADASFPIMVLSVAMLAAARSRLVILVVVMCFAASLLNHEIKLSLTVMAVAMLGWLREPGGRLKLTWVLAAMVPLMVAVPLLFATQYVEQTGRVLDNANFALRAKLFLRQADTGHCVDVVFDRHWQAPSRLDGLAQMFVGLVPRLVWRDKPQLSDGQYYAEEYCNRRGGEGTPNSATLTVIGEPLLLAGKAGLGVAVLTLAGIGWLGDWALRRWRWGLVVALALWPLAIDVDQNFMMYIARLGKGTLIVVGLALLSQWLVRVRRPMPTGPGVRGQS